jgi:hypothetical protein
VAVLVCAAVVLGVCDRCGRCGRDGVETLKSYKNRPWTAGGIFDVRSGSYLTRSSFFLFLWRTFDIISPWDRIHLNVGTVLFPRLPSHDFTLFTHFSLFPFLYLDSHVPVDTAFAFTPLTL